MIKANILEFSGSSESRVGERIYRLGAAFISRSHPHRSPAKAQLAGGLPAEARSGIASFAALGVADVLIVPT